MRRDNPKRDNVATALAVVLAITVLDVVAAQAHTARHSRRKTELRDYSDRSGFPQGLERARDAARNVELRADRRPSPQSPQVGPQ